MSAQPVWEDSHEDDLLTLVALGSPATPTADEEWGDYLRGLQYASQLDCGPIYPNTLRPMVRDRIAAQRIGAFTSRALAMGLVEYTGEWQTSDDTHGRNSGKPARIMRWIGPLTPVAGEGLGKTKPAAGKTPEGAGATPSQRPPAPTSPGGRDRSTRSHVADPVTASPVTGAVRFPADRQGARQYGPHDAASAPTTGTVRCGGKGGTYCAQPGCRQEHEKPLHPGLIAQRRRINELAAR